MYLMIGLGGILRKIIPTSFYILDYLIFNITVMLCMVMLFDLGNSQFKPVITDCFVKSIGYKHMVTLNWTLLNENNHLFIREYWIYCNCSDYEIDYTKVCMYVCI